MPTQPEQGTPHPRHGARWILLIVILAALAGIAIWHQTTTTKKEAPWRASVPAGRRNAEISRNGWSVKLRGGVGPRARLTIESDNNPESSAQRALAALTSSRGISAGTPVHVTLKGGRLKSRGALLTRSLSEPLPSGATAQLAYYDARRNVWRPVPTVVSANRSKLSAHVHHFSIWDDIVYDAGWLLDTRVGAPNCEQPTPSWIETVTYLNDENAPIRWCAGHDPHNPAVLVVKMAMNRSYGVAVRPATSPDWIYTSIFGKGPEDLLANLFARAYGLPDDLRNGFGGELPLLGGEEADFGFTEAQVKAYSGSPLIAASPDVMDALAGSTYSAIVDLAGLKDDPNGKKAAAVVALIAVAQCEGSILQPLSEHRWSTAAKGALNCLTDHYEQIVTGAATILVGALPRLDPKATGKLVGKVAGKLWIVFAADGLYKLGTWWADRHLNSAAFELHAFPTIIHKPPPTVSPPKATPAPVTPPPTLGLTPGAQFTSKCVVAWPTAPTHTSQGIVMTMSCSAVPENQYLFTQVTYDNPAFTITPSTGQVLVTGHVVDAARSDYGYSELLVQAENITKGMRGH